MKVIGVAILGLFVQVSVLVCEVVCEVVFEVVCEVVCEVVFEVVFEVRVLVCTGKELGGARAQQSGDFRSRLAEPQ
ncbi:hypothetical protein OAM67_01675 [bacterium]|nr:hypothetical protein [bacterium]